MPCHAKEPKRQDPAPSLDATLRAVSAELALPLCVSDVPAACQSLGSWLARAGQGSDVTALRGEGNSMGPVASVTSHNSLTHWQG